MLAGLKTQPCFFGMQVNKGLHLMRDGIKKAGARVPRGAPCRELTIYIAFFVCYVVLVTQECDYIKKTYEIQEGLKEMFVDDHPQNFENVQTVLQLGRSNYFLNDFWSWWEENVEGALYPCCAEDPDSYCCDVKPNLTQLTSGVYQVGAIRVRTKKVQPNSCSVNSRMTDTLDELGVKCYTDYEDSKQETLPYGENDRTVDYSYSGYIVDLPRSWHGDKDCEVKDSYGVALEADAKCNAGGGKVLAAMKGLAMYFFNFWNALELVNVSLLVLASIYRIQMAYNGWTTNEDELKNLVGYEYTNNEFLADINYQEISCTALNVLFSFLKVFKYLRVSPRMYLPWKTLERASTDLVCFMASPNLSLNMCPMPQCLRGELLKSALHTFVEGAGL
eukprot:gene4269-5256_t